VGHDVEVFPTKEALSAGAAELFASAATASSQAKGRFVVALSGGSTPHDLYARLAAEPYASGVPWKNVHVFWGDERCVPPHHIASNFHMAREALLDRVAIPRGNVHRISGEDEPGAAAAAYESELRAVFAAPTGDPPLTNGSRFDLVLLGLGADGHTASLFPRMQAVRETRRWVAAEYIDVVHMSRVTLTPVILNAAALVLFLVSGADKAGILRRVLDGPRDPDALPAQAIVPHTGRARWFVDSAAASDLQRT
jgi:6-phosphogluconolactonase